MTAGVKSQYTSDTNRYRATQARGTQAARLMDSYMAYPDGPRTVGRTSTDTLHKQTQSVVRPHESGCVCYIPYALGDAPRHDVQVWNKPKGRDSLRNGPALYSTRTASGQVPHHSGRECVFRHGQAFLALGARPTGWRCNRKKRR